jgi:phosphoribosylaminoimidazolecarboxamide formyltransferase/IMP cyclohydrolase
MSSTLSAMYRTRQEANFPDRITMTFGDRTLTYERQTWPHDNQSIGLRYGENPHQTAACYTPQGQTPALTWLKMGKGGPSWTNLADLDHAWRILRALPDGAAIVMKHLNPSGVAIAREGRDLLDTYRLARDCDARASFGGVVMFNRPVDLALAEELLTTFIEVVAAPAFSDQALERLSSKADLRIARYESTTEAPAAPDLKVLSDGSLLVQDPFFTRIHTPQDCLMPPADAGVRAPSEAEWADLLLAWHVACGVRSNAVVLVRDGQTLAVGTGEQERVGAVEQAIAKALQKGHTLAGAVVASDGFFPFRDAIDHLAHAGVKAVIQPGGSVRDNDVFGACREHDLAMVLTGERCFAHF